MIQSETILSPKPNIVADCQLMLGFALEDGKDLGAEIERLLVIVDHWLAIKGEAPISGIPVNLLAASQMDGSVPLETKVDIIQTFLDLRDRLSVLIHPATTHSLRATETHRRGFARYLEMPLIIKFAIVAAIICMVGFICTLPKPVKQTVAPEVTNSAAPKPSLSK